MKYHNITVLKFLIISLIFLFNITSNIAQSGIGQNSHRNPRTTVVKICGSGYINKYDATAESLCGNGKIWGSFTGDEPNEIEILLTAFTVDLPINNGLPYFPIDHPIPSLKYTYDDGFYNYTEELKDWTFLDKVEGFSGIEHNIYYSSKVVSIIVPEDIFCDDESATIEFSIDLKLSTYDEEKGIFVDYPIMTYGGLNGIFSCDVYEETKHICDPNLKPVEVSHVAEVCTPCLDDEAVILSTTENTLIEDDRFIILSNPFSEIIAYEFYNSKDAVLTESLYTTEGQLVFTKTSQIMAGENQLSINTENITAGIYYLAVRTEGQNYIKKVICVK